MLSHEDQYRIAAAANELAAAWVSKQDTSFYELMHGDVNNRRSMIGKWVKLATEIYQAAMHPFEEPLE